MRTLAWLGLSLLVVGCSTEMDDASSATSEAVSTCAEFTPGAPVASTIGGSQASRTAVQAAADYAGVAASLVSEVTNECALMASTLGVAQADLDAALAETSLARRVVATCRLATVGCGVAATTTPSAVRIEASAPVCSVPSISACAAGCVPASASCVTACDASAQAKVTCTVPQIAVTGTPSPELLSAVNGHLGRLLAAHARLRGMAERASTLASSMASVTDVQAVCIPVVISATSNAAQQVIAGTTATSELKATLGL